MIPRLESIDIRKLLTDIHEFGMWCSDGSNTTIHFQSLPFNLPMEGMSDLNWLRQNLYCMIGNAVKYSLPSGDGVTVTVEYIENKENSNNLDSLLTILVKDCGESLSPSAVDNFFDNPVQRNRTQMGGMGQGVYCLKQRVFALGGDCGVSGRSDGKSGTIVWFSIPFTNSTPENLLVADNSVSNIAVSNAKMSGASAREDKILDINRSEIMGLGGLTPSVSAMCHHEALDTSTSYPRNVIIASLNSDVPQDLIRAPLHNNANVLQDLRILVVDDSVPILKMMVKLLKQANAIVTESKNGQEALNKFIESEGDFDIVITDIQVCKSLET